LAKKYNGDMHSDWLSRCKPNYHTIKTTPCVSTRIQNDYYTCRYIQIILYHYISKDASILLWSSSPTKTKYYEIPI